MLFWSCLNRPCKLDLTPIADPSLTQFFYFDSVRAWTTIPTDFKPRPNCFDSTIKCELFLIIGLNLLGQLNKTMASSLMDLIERTYIASVVNIFFNLCRPRPIHKTHLQVTERSLDTRMSERLKLVGTGAFPLLSKCFACVPTVHN